MRAWLLLIPYCRQGNWDTKTINNLSKSKVTNKMLGQITNPKSYYDSGLKIWPQSLWHTSSLWSKVCVSSAWIWVLVTALTKWNGRSDIMWFLRLGHERQAASVSLADKQWATHLGRSPTPRPTCWKGPCSSCSGQESQLYPACLPYLAKCQIRK